ncbi:isoaspartyl peptidase/L-asparaginase family protein [Chromobacterium sp. IIBBL 290-4]|uniref:isoaspartyl peptidase/L-asparaginase family protein n=1 Tax=Chromobacterium sp. IIBBL 290-4 TaxID=2953890 RepID=UPI0020B83DD1|nr:isoaspartyl peptidase/L-asparaginase [Chromobacterium sp. IIBBL 290-4]UTH76547.1 isoaspartyl peptidase/L-asparaginase [Chromobacterium sp. IIBBL 290-4]
MTIALALHGGAGTLRRSDMNPELEDAYRQGLERALEAGHAILRAGGSALDAVCASVCALEDDPLFNAGRGSVYNLDGKQEMEAAVMDGCRQDAGSVTGLAQVQNPVRLARAVMENTPHVTLGFAAAEDFSRRIGLPMQPPEYFHTDKRWQALQLEKERIANGGGDDDIPEDRKHGTVGAVALDAQGRLAAATSTGGRTAKWAGRIGDTPVIGAGTWADAHCAVSGTGHGEYFVRAAVGHEISARLRYLDETLASACDAVVHGQLTPMGGTGGVAAVDRFGRVALPFNCEGMYRAAIDGEGRKLIAIYRDENQR